VVAFIFLLIELVAVILVNTPLDARGRITKGTFSTR
jgi:hypothetical protein